MRAISSANGGWRSRVAVCRKRVCARVGFSRGVARGKAVPGWAAEWFVVGAPKTRCPHPQAPVPRVDAGPRTQSIDSPGWARGSCVGAKTKSLHSRKSVPGGGDLCGGEERRAGVGARSALHKHSHRGCPSGESAANAASSAVRPRPEHHSAVDTQCDRHSVSPRRVPTSATRPSCREVTIFRRRQREKQNPRYAQGWSAVVGGYSFSS